MKVKVCHIISDLDQSVFIDAIGKFLDGGKYELDFVFLGATPPALYTMLKEKNHRVEFIEFNDRKELPQTIFRLRRLLADMRPDIVHTHMVNASLAGLVAARLSGIRRRVHTRHHSSECHIYYPHAVYYDKLVSKLSTRIVAISQAVADVLIQREGVNPQKIHLIRHGFDLAGFKSDEVAAQEIEQKYKLTRKYPVVGVISRFVHWKGIQYVIPAFKKLSEEYPQAKLVLANAIGSYSEQIRALLEESLNSSQYVLVPFEPRVFDLYKNFDVFVHVPINKEFEAFGQVYIEPLAMGVPSVFTLSGVASEFIKDKINAVVVPYENSEAIYQAVKLLLEDGILRERIVKQGRADVCALFNAEKMAVELDLLYSSLL